MRVARVQAFGLAIGVEGIGDLIVARFVQGTQVVPDFTDVRIEADSPRVCVESVTVLRDLVVEHTDGTPEGWVAQVTVDGLLERFVGRIEVASDHVHTAEIIPQVGVQRVDFDGLREVLQRHGQVLLERSTGVAVLGLAVLILAVLALVVLVLDDALVARLCLRVQAAQLLQDLGVVGIHLKNLLVRLLGARPVLLLLKHQTNLEPHVGLGERMRWVGQDVLEALQRARKLALVLVDDSETEVDLVGLVKVRVQVQHTHKRLFGVLQGAVSVVENANAVPQLGHVGVVQVVERPLVCGVSSLQVVHHQVAVAQEPPGVAVFRVERQGLLVELSRLQKMVSRPVDVGQARQGVWVVGVVAQRRVVQQNGLFQVAERLGQRANGQPRGGGGFKQHRQPLGRKLAGHLVGHLAGHLRGHLVGDLAGHLRRELVLRLCLRHGLCLRRMGHHVHLLLERERRRIERRLLHGHLDWQRHGVSEGNEKRLAGGMWQQYVAAALGRLIQQDKQKQSSTKDKACGRRTKKGAGENVRWKPDTFRRTAPAAGAKIRRADARKRRGKGPGTRIIWAFGVDMTGCVGIRGLQYCCRRFLYV